MTEEAQGRTYRFPTLDRTGWLLGLSGAQCLTLGAGVLVAGLFLESQTPALLVLAPLVGAAVLAFGRWSGQLAIEWLPALARTACTRVRRQGTWTSALPRVTTSGGQDSQPVLPPFLAGLTISDAEAAGWDGLSRRLTVGVVHDAAAHTVSASLPVSGQGFSLLERDDQDRVIAGWGDALAGFCQERSPVVGVRVSEWTGPAGLGEFECFAEAQRRAAEGSPALRSYRQVLAEAAPSTTRHDVLVTVTVAMGRARRRRTGMTSQEAATTVLLGELGLLAGRLRHAGLEVGAPLTPGRVAETLRLRFDPSGMRIKPGVAGSLAAMAGLVSRYDAGPLATATGWRHLQVDGSFHRTYWVAEWPRLDVPAGWLEPLLLHAGGIRTFALHCEPVPPSRSRRDIDRDATRLAADGEQRSRAGFRVGARHRRSEDAVLQREAELVAGHAELAYAGFITVTADDEEALEASCANYEQAAALAGLELRPLFGRQDLAFACSLPLGRGLAPRRVL